MINEPWFGEQGVSSAPYCPWRLWRHARESRCSRRTLSHADRDGNESPWEYQQRHIDYCEPGVFSLCWFLLTTNSHEKAWKASENPNRFSNQLALPNWFATHVRQLNKFEGSVGLNRWRTWNIFQFHSSIKTQKLWKPMKLNTSAQSLHDVTRCILPGNTSYDVFPSIVTFYFGTSEDLFLEITYHFFFYLRSPSLE